MTIVLTPYWSAADGTQKLRVEEQPKPPPAEGLLPPGFSREIHLQRALLQLRSKTSDIEKYIFLFQLKDADVDSFYRLCLAHMSEITQIIYTPTVGDACLQYSKNFRRPEGLYISLKNKGNIGTILRNWPGIIEARISVVTDGSRILGLGDLGLNGMPIPIGKLSLYVTAAGIRPSSTIPITLDLGTNNQAFLDDPLYLGLRQKRASAAEYDEFMEEFMTEMSRVFPKLLVQFEDFSTDHAFSFLSRFRHRFRLFNDDIQGTGAVVLAGLISAARLPPLQTHEHLWSKGDPVFDAFYRSIVPNLASAVEVSELMKTAGSELLDRIGVRDGFAVDRLSAFHSFCTLTQPAVVVTHSQSGYIGWILADVRPNLVKAIVALEPVGPPFQNAIFARNWARVFGLTDIPLTFDPPISSPSDLRPVAVLEAENYTSFQQPFPPRRLVHLAKIPVLVVTSEAGYHAVYEDATVQFLREAGVDVTHIRLENIGIRGNGHMFFMELNSDRIAAEVVEPWIERSLGDVG